jgi:DNA-binding XRE family transcriptional regulator
MDVLTIGTAASAADPCSGSTVTDAVTRVRAHGAAERAPAPTPAMRGRPLEQRPYHLPLLGLATCRSALGLTQAQAQLAVRAGMARETVLRLERGRPASMVSVEKLSKAQGSPIEELTRATRIDESAVGPVRTCTECGITKPLSAGFVPIKGCRGYYGRCRACRAAAARRRYHSNEQVRRTDIQRNNACSSLSVTSTVRRYWGGTKV